MLPPGAFQGKMAVDASLIERELDKFKSYNVRLKKTVFQDNEECRRVINLLLDDFNGIEYSLKIVSQEVKTPTPVMSSISMLCDCHLTDSYAGIMNTHVDPCLHGYQAFHNA